MEFKAITTQEELNEIIQNRLARQKEMYEKQIAEIRSKADESEALQTKLNEQMSALEDMRNKSKEASEEYSAMQKKLQSYETQELKRRVALASGLSYELADRLVGEDEETLHADAKRLLSFVGNSTSVAPLKNNEPKINDKDEVYRNLIKNLESK